MLLTLIVGPAPAALLRVELRVAGSQPPRARRPKGERERARDDIATGGFNQKR